MDLTPYLDGLRRDLAASAAAGGEDISRAADLLAGSMDSSARLCLMEALSDAAAEVTTQLASASVEVRLRGREAALVVTEVTHPEPAPPPSGSTTTTTEGSGDVARITLRLPEGLKEQVERAAATEGISVNAWLVRAVTSAVAGHLGPPPPPPPPPPFPPGPEGRNRRAGRASLGKRVTGYAQA